MMSGRLRVVLAIAVLSIAPVRGYAQEAALSGTVTRHDRRRAARRDGHRDARGVGNTFEAVTDERGAFRLPVRIGVYRITAELAGLRDGRRGPAWSCWSASRRSSTCRWRRPRVQETVTVTGEAPLVDDDARRRVERQHRPAADAGAAAQRPQLDGPRAAGAGQPRATRRRRSPRQRRQGYFQLNVDGQQVTQHRRQAGVRPAAVQPRRDRGVRVRLEPVRRDAGPLDRRAGERHHQVGHQHARRARSPATSATTASTPTDFIQQRVLPYSNQQFSATFGGPIRRDRIHFFANYEYEREPQTVTYNEPVSELQHRPDEHAQRSTWAAVAARHAVLAADAARGARRTTTTR